MLFKPVQCQSCQTKCTQCCTFHLLRFCSTNFWFSFNFGIMKFSASQCQTCQTKLLNAGLAIFPVSALENFYVDRLLPCCFHRLLCFHCSPALVYGIWFLTFYFSLKRFATHLAQVVSWNHVFFARPAPPSHDGRQWNLSFQKKIRTSI